jgi:hypothetical protein
MEAYSNYEESVVVRIKSNLLLMIFWLQHYYLQFLIKLNSDDTYALLIS